MQRTFLTLGEIISSKWDTSPAIMPTIYSSSSNYAIKENNNDPRNPISPFLVSQTEVASVSIFSFSLTAARNYPWEIPMNEWQSLWDWYFFLSIPPLCYSFPPYPAQVSLLNSMLIFPIIFWMYTSKFPNHSANSTYPKWTLCSQCFTDTSQLFPSLCF